MASRLLSRGFPARSISKTPRPFIPTRRPYHRDAGIQQLLRLSPEVADAIATNKPVVALESTIYTHGALGADLPGLLENLVRQHGAVPAVCGVLAGIPTVGLTTPEVERMVNEGARKLSRRDLAYVVGMVSKTRNSSFCLFRRTHFAACFVSDDDLEHLLRIDRAGRDKRCTVARQ